MSIQLFLSAPASASPLSKLSGVADQITQHIPTDLPGVPLPTGNISTFLENAASDFIEKAKDSGEDLSQASSHFTRATLGTSAKFSATALSYGKALGQDALDTGSFIGSQALSAGAAIGTTALSTGADLGETALSAGNTALRGAISLGHSASDGAILLIHQGAHTTTYTVQELATYASELFKKGAEPYLMEALKEIDTAALTSVVDTFRNQNPDLNTGLLTRKFISNKRDSALTEDEWQSIAVSLTEMIYEVAGLYGLDLQDHERKAEVFKITSLGLGSAFLASQITDIASFAAGFAVPSNLVDLGRGGSHALAKVIMFWRVGEAACDYYESVLSVQPIEQT